LLVVFVTMPIVIHALGADAFGLFSLAWVVLGYMAILDFGVSRAATKFISEHLSRGELAPVERIARASVAANLVLGIIGGSIVLALAGWLANRVFHVPVELQTEARTIFRALAMSIPILLVQAVLRAILCSYQRFGWISIFNALATTLQWTSACALAWLGFHVGMIVVVSVVFRALLTAAAAPFWRLGHHLAANDTAPSLPRPHSHCFSHFGRNGDALRYPL
jgi:O-antigen/teichoic acid export membrane protein